MPATFIGIPVVAIYLFSVWIGLIALTFILSRRLGRDDDRIRNRRRQGRGPATMISINLVLIIAVAYVGLLFVLAYVSDKKASQSRGGFLRSPLVYTLSISVYCTSWTFYGAVGSAARNNFEFLAIYIGPTLIFIGWWFILRKLVRIAQRQRITSVADLLSSRFGKSGTLGVLVTLIAVVGTTPYIALQLKAITQSIQVITSASDPGGLSGFDTVSLGFGAAACMALFTILFGTRNVDAKEQHHGVVAAIAFEAVVKLVAFLAVGIFVVFGISGGPMAIYQGAAEAGIDIARSYDFGPRWVAILVLSAAAVLCLPRQFQITVVENSDERHLRTAAWAFPTYLLLMSLFTMPIAIYGLTVLPQGSNPDMFVLTLPLTSGNAGLALFAFIGGFSSATSMIILATIALSIMVSNHIVMPIALRSSESFGNAGTGGVTRLLLNSRRASIGFILFLGFLYFWLSGNSDALAAIGLISFAGVAQFLPAMIAALYWREATVHGAITGTLIGFLVWAWTMFLPSFASTSPAIAEIIASGPLGHRATKTTEPVRVVRFRPAGPLGVLEPVPQHRRADRGITRHTAERPRTHSGGPVRRYLQAPHPRAAQFRSRLGQRLRSLFHCPARPWRPACL